MTQPIFGPSGNTQATSESSVLSAQDQASPVFASSGPIRVGVIGADAAAVVELQWSPSDPAVAANWMVETSITNPTGGKAFGVLNAIGWWRLVRTDVAATPVTVFFLASLQ